MLPKAFPSICLSAITGLLCINLAAQELNPVTLPDNASATISTVPAIDRSANAGSRDVFTLAAGMNDNATLVNAIKACGMENNIRSKPSITVFAPSNTAFAKLPPGLIEQMMKPENIYLLNKLISYHIIEGNHTTATLREDIKAGKGRAIYTTLSGNRLIATIEENKIRLTDDGNNACFITMSDIKGSNGMLHVLDKVALPR
ncbi:fasciclin domain-containing protein [Flavitalea antarctica]